MLRTFLSKVTTWEVKKLYIYYTLEKDKDSNIYIKTIPIEPFISSCNNIISSSICSSSPGCMFCNNYPGIRLLQSINNTYISNIAYTNYSLLQRVLYNNIVPDAISTYSSSDLSGSCISSIYVTDCPLTIEDPINLKYSKDGWAWLTFIIISIVAVIAILLYSHEKFIL